MACKGRRTDVITFHEIRRIIQKMAVLSSHIVHMNQLLPQVIELSEKIDSLNEDLTLERDRITAKIRSVEVLGEILKTHVYQNSTETGRNGLGGGPCPDQGLSVEDSPPLGNETCPPDQTGPGVDEGNQSCFHRKLDGSSMML